MFLGHGRSVPSETNLAGWWSDSGGSSQRLIANAARPIQTVHDLSGSDLERLQVSTVYGTLQVRAAVEDFHRWILK